MFCLNCFPRDNSDDSTETPNKKIHIKHCHTKHYTLIPDANTQHLTQFNFIPHKFDSIIFPWLTIRAFEIKKILSNQIVPVIYIKNKNSFDSNYTIIFAHSPQHNIGQNFPFLIDLSSQLRTDIISFDYTNPEINNSTSLENSYITDLEQVIEFSVSKLKIEMNTLVLMSKSLGSISVLGVAAKEEFKAIKGIILLSPIARGYTLRYKKFIEDYDALTKANSILARTFLIHGKKDNVINVEQSELLAKSIRYVSKWFPSKENHSNLLTYYRCKFYSNIKKFINDLDFSYLYAQNDFDSTVLCSKRSSLSFLRKQTETKDSENSAKKRLSSASITIAASMINLVDEEYENTEKFLAF